MDNSVIIKGSKSGITVFLDNEMPFEELLESVSDKFKNASKFFNNANMAISFDGRDLSAEEEKRILNVISDVSELNIVCVLDENNNIDEEALKLLLSNIENTPVAFHRAFEEVPDYKKAMDTLKKYPKINRVLTTFGSKDLKKDISKIKEYLDYAKSIDLNIIIGGGVNLDNLETLVKETDISQIHIGSAAKINRNPILDLDPEAVEKIMKIVHGR